MFCDECFPSAPCRHCSEGRALVTSSSPAQDLRCEDCKALAEAAQASTEAAERARMDRVLEFLRSEPAGRPTSDAVAHATRMTRIEANVALLELSDLGLARPVRGTLTTWRATTAAEIEETSF